MINFFRETSLPRVAGGSWSKKVQEGPRKVQGRFKERFKKVQGRSKKVQRKVQEGSKEGPRRFKERSKKVQGKPNEGPGRVLGRVIQVVRGDLDRSMILE